MSQLLKILAVLAEGILRLLSTLDRQKQEKRDEEIKNDPVGSFEQRFGELHNDPSSQRPQPDMSAGTTESRQTATRDPGTGDIPDRP